ncbi:hypothetical protein KVR01_011730 [Diaporthe batatas]|uniref:uncharacterized protein n=1 Tax=Diaporthe batatas TaxID=748121 RepID=UPI001D04645B|nr:uncharacterized protein KVR01_011730 [Diaporthe batatas]KAG8158608.1 hypothetical protein KVR01_011730 [Diaporthe batatas]
MAPLPRCRGPLSPAADSPLSLSLLVPFCGFVARLLFPDARKLDHRQGLSCRSRMQVILSRGICQSPAILARLPRIYTVTFEKPQATLSSDSSYVEMTSLVAPGGPGVVSIIKLGRDMKSREATDVSNVPISMLPR